MQSNPSTKNQSSSTECSERDLIMTPSVSEHNHDSLLSPGVRNLGRPRSRSCVPLLQPHTTGPKRTLEDADCHVQAPIFSLDLAAEAIAETCRTVYTAHRAAVLDFLAGIAQSDVAKEDKGRLTERSLKRRVSGLSNDRSSIAASLLEKDVTKCPYKYLAGKYSSTEPDTTTSQHQLVEPTLFSIRELTSNKDDSVLGLPAEPNIKTHLSDKRTKGLGTGTTLASKPNKATKKSLCEGSRDAPGHKSLSHSHIREASTTLHQGALEDIEPFSTVERVQSWQSDQIHRQHAPRLRRVESAPMPAAWLLAGHTQRADADGQGQSRWQRDSGSNNHYTRPLRGQQERRHSATPHRGHLHGRRPPPGPNRQSTSIEIHQKHKYHCVYHGSGHEECNAHCATKKKHVAHLRRHHETRHGFFYCTKCFQTFGNLGMRKSHETHGCGSICVTEGCANNGEAADSSCNHEKPSSTAIWRALFRLARPRDQVPDPDLENQTQAHRLSSGLQHRQPQASQLLAQSLSRSELDGDYELTSGSEEDGGPPASPSGHTNSLTEMTADMTNLSQLAHELDLYYPRLDPRSIQEVELLQQDMSIALKRLSRLLEDCRSRFPHAVHLTAEGSTTATHLLPGQGSFETPLQREAAPRLPQPAPSAMFGSFRNVDGNLGVMDITDSSPNTNYSGYSGPPPASFDPNSRQFRGTAYGLHTAQEPYQQQYGNSTINQDEDAPYDNLFSDASNWNRGSGNWA